MGRKYIYAFGNHAAEGNGDMKALLGGKGAGLAEMTNAGVPVPPGFTLTTDVCNLYRETQRIPSEVERQLHEHLEVLERATGKVFGDPRNPLLLSVRSGAKFSMPGMMDTVLNLGLGARTLEGLAEKSHDRRFALDAYRRLIQMYSNVVLGVDHHAFELEIGKLRQARGAKSDADLSAADLEALVARYHEVVQQSKGHPFPEDPKKQLFQAIEAVFRSWDNPRAQRYRQLNDIPHELGTACTVQAMVFGNRGDTSGSGVGFTRNPSDGERKIYGEFLLNAQGEDVVAGTRTPRPLAELATVLPEVHAELESIALELERHYGEMQDFEFTIEQGKLYMLQTRTGKRTGPAAVRIATDMVDEGLITREEAVVRVEPVQLLQLLHPVFDPKERHRARVVARGLNASPGAASGEIVLTADEAVTRAAQGVPVVLVRSETSPDDIHGMAKAVGLFTATGGMTSHAAVVGRQMGKPAVVGCGELAIDRHKNEVRIGLHTAKVGDWVSIDGTTGDVMLAKLGTVPAEVVQVCVGSLPAAESPLYASFQRLLAWADLTRRLRVRANADTGEDARLALAFGAEGIGLCRTEHMFFAEDRIARVREMILARSEEARRRALEHLLPMQRSDFIEIFRAMNGLPVTVRTLDPPLHEFLPNPTELKVELEVMKARGQTEGVHQARREELEKLLERVLELAEFNPMLGWRGCRLTIICPEIIEMQVRAILEAAAACLREGCEVRPEIMIPLVGHVTEFERQKTVVTATAKAVMKEQGLHVAYTLGTMIEVPRAALTADKIAKESEFFSFGTNDLTQTTFGFSRDDAGKFLGRYVEDRILPRDPFVSIDREGVGELMRIAVERGRSARQGLKLGICGEHGGDPQSIGFCHDLGLDYVSCSPYRIPVARLAAAQAVLHERGVEELRMRARQNARARRPPTYAESVPESQRRPTIPPP